MDLFKLYDNYSQLMNNGDERVKDWLFMQSPLPTISICLSYVILVKYLGPYFMKNRDALNIRWLMVFYNFLMVIISLYIFLTLGYHGWFGKYNYKCQPVDYSDSPDAIGMAHLAWWYYISKYIEFADTIFFVLRKKYSHVSTLHVIHHGVMPMSVWWGVKFTPGGHSTFFAFVNSFVHILMYIYYGLAAIGPQMYKYLFWKKYMTTIQMVQFIMIFIHSFQLLFRECNYPRGFMWWIGFHAVLFWFLFMDFYKTTYSKKNIKKSHSQSPSSFFACSQTENLINGLNKNVSLVSSDNTSTTLVKRKGNSNELSYSSTIKNGFTNGNNMNNGMKGGKDL